MSFIGQLKVPVGDFVAGTWVKYNIIGMQIEIVGSIVMTEDEGNMNYQEMIIEPILVAPSVLQPHSPPPSPTMTSSESFMTSEEMTFGSMDPPEDPNFPLPLRL